jgi:hypothetical protein
MTTMVIIAKRNENERNGTRKLPSDAIDVGRTIVTVVETTMTATTMTTAASVVRPRRTLVGNGVGGGGKNKDAKNDDGPTTGKRSRQ